MRGNRGGNVMVQAKQTSFLEPDKRYYKESPKPGKKIT